MLNMIPEIIGYTLYFLGLILPLLIRIWTLFCKYILHFRKDCNNYQCLCRCKKCPPLHSETLELRIAMLEQKLSTHPTEDGYIWLEILKKKRDAYLADPLANRETTTETLRHLTKQTPLQNKDK